MWVLGALALLSDCWRCSRITRTMLGLPIPAIRRRWANWIGPVGAWLAGFFLFLVRPPGLPLSHDAGLCRLAGAQGAGAAGCSFAHQHAAARRGVCPHVSSPAAAWRPCIGTVRHCRTAQAACSARWSGQGSARGLSFSGRYPCCCWECGWRAWRCFLGVSWFEVMDKLGAWVLQGIEWTQTRLEQRRELASGQQRKQARQGSGARGAKEGGEPAAAPHRGRRRSRIDAFALLGTGAPSRGGAPVPQKSERVERERQVPLFDAPTSSELPALSLLDEAGSARAIVFRRGVGSHVAAGGNQVARLWSRG